MNIIIKIGITLVIVYILIYGILVIKNVWTKNLDIKRTLPNPFGWVHFTKQHSLPELKFSLGRLTSNFEPGIQVDGVTWEADFSQYFLKITNTKAEIQDLRLDIDFLGGIVTKEIRLQEGTDHIIFSQAGFFNTGIGGKDGKIHRTFEAYTNNLKISCSKVFSSGYFEIKLVLKELNIDTDGLFEVSYRYLDENNEQKQWANRYKILRHDNGAMYIDSENPFKDAVMRSVGMIPKKPLVFKKDGSINEK